MCAYIKCKNGFTLDRFPIEVMNQSFHQLLRLRSDWFENCIMHRLFFDKILASGYLFLEIAYIFLPKGTHSDIVFDAVLPECWRWELFSYHGLVPTQKGEGYSKLPAGAMIHRQVAVHNISPDKHGQKLWSQTVHKKVQSKTQELSSRPGLILWNFSTTHFLASNSSLINMPEDFCSGVTIWVAHRGLEIINSV